MTPKRLNGAKEARFFIQQSGSNRKPVTDNNTLVRSLVCNRLLNVSARIILYAKQPEKVMKIALNDGIHEELSPKLSFQPSP
mmetsp:Transcript_15732/g.17464  ORF Transcript_15732/g.17464 Transcript_15732/m.17464 type:complete len:82 (-) Transcript_15732:313-558(-)